MPVREDCWFWRPLRHGGLALFLAAGPAQAAEPVRHIGIYVQPFYEGAKTAQGTPRVRVNKHVDALLASNKRADILAARDQIMGNARMVTPMTMMVLAIRFYDVGLRDDAVFWLYAAKDRYFVMAGVLDTKHPSLVQAEDAVRNFATLAGPFINGYAFCDLANQAALRKKALDWVEANPYAVMFMQDIKALPGDRAANYKIALAKQRADAEKERAYLADAKNAANFRAERKKNQMDEKFCWK